MKARVIDNKDPDKKGRIRVKTVLFGDSNWIPFLRTPGFFGVPEVGDVTYVTADGGDSQFLLACGNLTDGPSDENMNEAFDRIFPSNRGLYSANGHLIELDDGTTPLKIGKGIRLTTSDGSIINIAEDLTSKKITLQRTEGQKIEIDGLLDSITLANAVGDEVKISATGGIEGTTTTGATFSFSAGAAEIATNSASVNLSAVGDISVANSTATIEASASGDLSVAGPTGSLEISNTGAIELKNAVGALNITEIGQVELKGAAAGVVELIADMCTALSTQTAAGFGALTSTAPQFVQLAAKANALKA